VATAGAEAAVAVVSTEEVSEVAVSTAAVLVVGSKGEGSAAALSAGVVVVSVGGVLPVAVFVTVAFVVAVLMGEVSSAATAIQVGGAGAIRTDITVTTITHTITMDTAGTHTATMDTAGTVTTVAAVTDTAMAADQRISGVRGAGDKPGQGSLRSAAG